MPIVCKGANLPHFDATFDIAKCPECTEFMTSYDIDNDNPKGTDLFICDNCTKEATRYELFLESLDLSNNYDLARSILFSEESIENPNTGLWDRVNKAIDAVQNNPYGGLSEDKAEKIVCTMAECYTCGKDHNTKNLTVTYDYTNIKPFYICKRDRWMIGGF